MRTTARSKRQLILIVIAPLLIAGYLSTDNDTLPVSTDNDTLPECPHDWDFTKIQIKKRKQLVTLQTLNPTNLSAPQAQTDVPEFNDCQRLVLGKGQTAVYDSLYAVFARDSLDYLKELGIQIPLQTGAAAVPMVEILSLGGTYPKLALKPGLNCLFVYTENNEWHARMAAFGSEEQDCHSPRPVNAVLSSPELSITRTNLNLETKDNPAVARWEWDVNSNTQVIGFRCLNEWCEVGERGHVPETGPDLTTTMGGIDGLAGSVLKVKGWYDEQRLSPTAQHWWHPGAGPMKVVGTIVPVPGLDQLDSPSFDHTWKIVAYVNLSEPSSEYHAAASFAPIAGGKVTTISLCREDWEGPHPLPTGKGCPKITKELREAAKCNPEVTATTIHWWAVTMPADNSNPRYRCIVRRSVPENVPVPGTARWRWLADDDTSWHRCGGACCSDH